MHRSYHIHLSNLSEHRFDALQKIYFVFFLRGLTQISIEGLQEVMEPNDYLLTGMNDPITIMSTNHTLAYVFEIDELELMRLSDAADLPMIHSKRINSALNKQVTLKFFHFVNTFFDIKQNHLLIESALLQFLDTLFQMPTGLAYDASLTHGDSDRIYQIKQIIHRNLNTRMSIEDLASELYLSPQYVSKYIKEKFGVTYLHYISNLRMKFAEKDLLETKLSLTAIAHRRGFANVNTLIRTFKTHHSMTPKAYRALHTEHMKEERNDFGRVTESEVMLAKEQVKSYVSKEQSEDIWTGYASKVLNIDVKQGQVMEKSISKTINLGFARNVLTNAFQAQVSKLQVDLGFTYARFQGIFEHGIIDRIPNTEHYNFSKANRILDFLYANQLLPFIEMGNKPEKINFSAEQYVSLSETNKLYRNSQEWQQLVKGFIKNCINRYGTTEVSKWIFDYWYPHGKALEYSLSYAEMYIHNYRILYDSIKHYLPMAMIGGMSLNMTGNESAVSSIVNMMMIKKVPFDFISITAFHTEDEVHMVSLTTNPNYLSDRVNHLKKNTSLSKIPLILAEWCFDVSTRNYLHDSLFMGSFILKNLIEQSDSFYDMAYWLMSDLMIEFTDTNHVLFGGNGLLSVDGLPKPSYFAYQFYRRLGKRIIQKGDGYVITSNSMDSYQVLLYHYQHPSETYCKSHHSDASYDVLSRMLSDQKMIQYSIRLSSLVKGHYRIKKHLLSADSGSILNEWIHLGGTNHLSNSEIQYLKNITQPAIRLSYSEETDLIQLDESLKSHEMMFIQISLEYKES